MTNAGSKCICSSVQNKALKSRQLWERKDKLLYNINSEHMMRRRALHHLPFVTGNKNMSLIYQDDGKLNNAQFGSARYLRGSNSNVVSLVFS